MNSAPPDGSAVIAHLLAGEVAVRFPARGDSMYPLIRENDTLHVEPLGSAPLRGGEVVLARTVRGLTAHRVISVASGMAIMRGDNSPAPDHPALVGDILGRVVALERGGRRIRIRPWWGPLLVLVRMLDRMTLRLRRS